MNDLTEDAPCARGCTWAAASEDEAPRPKPAKHGHLCNSCFYRLTGALKLVPDLMANMRAQLFSLGAADYSERVSGGGDGSPAPLNLGPLDASDALFAKLIGWTEVFAEEFDVRAPTFPTWANGREVQGSKPVTVEAAHDLAARMTGWLADRLEEIAGSRTALAFYSDIVEGHEDARGVFSLSAQYGVRARPTREADKRECPICGGMDVFLKLPNTLDADYAVICGRCAWMAEPELYAKHTGRSRYAAIVATRGGTCVVCVGKIKPGTLINRIEGMTTHDGCEGFIETKEERHAEREVGHPKAVVVHVGKPRGLLAGVALLDTPSDLQRERPPVLVRSRPGVRDGSRESDSVKFAAKYAGPCAGGCDGIEPGDEVQYVDDNVLMHTDCENSEGLRAETRETQRETCPDCWVIMPCGCGEF